MKTKKILILLCFIVSTPSYSTISAGDFDENMSLDTLDSELNTQLDLEVAELVQKTCAESC